MDEVPTMAMFATESTQPTQPSQASGSRIRDLQASGSVRRPWTSEEDRLLRVAVNKYTRESRHAVPWMSISREVGGGRSIKSCRKRWFYTLDPNLRRGRWTKDEDEVIRAAFAEFGPQWKEIAMRTSGRTDEQVAKRWRDVLSPELKLDRPWTSDEDRLLLRLYQELGPRWTLMSDSFPGRNGIACRNRFRRHRTLGAVETPTMVDSAPESKDSGMWTPTEDGIHNDFPFNHSTLPSVTGHGNVELDFDLFPIPGGSQHLFGFDSPVQEGDASPTSSTFSAWLSHMSAAPVQHCQASESSSNNDKSGTVVNDDTSLSFEDEHVGLVARNSDEPVFTPWMEFQQAGSTGIDGLIASVPVTGIESADRACLPGVNSNSVGSPNTSALPPLPIRNAWGLLQALERGEEVLTVTATLVRQLLADAAS